MSREDEEIGIESVHRLPSYVRFEINMRAPATLEVRPAMIPWIIALFLSLLAGSFSPAPPSDQAGDLSDAAWLSQVGEDAKSTGRSSTTPIKLPTISWDLPVTMRPVAFLLRVEHGDAHWLRQFAFRQERGRAPPEWAAL